MRKSCVDTYVSSDGICKHLNNLSGNYKLICDIDLAGWNWVPIGKGNDYFSGVFNGNGHKIYNLTIINSNTSAGYGLFAQSYGIIRNVSLENINIVGINNFPTHFVDAFAFVPIFVGVKFNPKCGCQHCCGQIFSILT